MRKILLFIILFSAFYSHGQTSLEYFQQGCGKLNQKDYAGAIIDYNKAIKIKPADYASYWQRGNAKIYLKDTVGAMEDYSKAIDLMNQNLKITKDGIDSVNLARSYAKRGTYKYELRDYKGAIEDINIAFELQPLGTQPPKMMPDNDTPIQHRYKYYYYRGLSKYNLKDTLGACLDWNKAVELGNGMAEAKELLEKYCK